MMSANSILLLATMLLLSFLRDSACVAAAAAAAAAEGNYNGHGIGNAVPEARSNSGYERYPRKALLLQNTDYAGGRTHPSLPHQLEEDLDYDPPHVHPPPVHKHSPGHPERHLVDSLDYVPARTRPPTPGH